MDDIKKIITESNNPKDLREELDRFHPYDIANVFPSLENDERIKLYQIYNNQELAEIFSFIDEEKMDMFEDISNEYAASILNEMPTDDAVDVFTNLDKKTKKEILDLVDDDTKQDIIKLSTYDDNCAGSIMDNDFLWIKEHADVKEAMRKVVKNAPEVETINTIFVVDDNMTLKGVVGLKKLISTASPCDINNIMGKHFQFVEPTLDIDETLKIIRDYDIMALPVCENGTIIGIITMDDAMEAYTEEAGHDYARFSGLLSEEEYDESTLSSIKKRIPWLAILLVLDIFVSLIISSFDEVISTVTVLVLFQPVILGLAGNSGTQSLAVSVRKFGNNELNTRGKAFRHLSREFLTGIFQGILLGIIAFSTSMLFLLMINMAEPFTVASLVAMTVFCTLSISSLLGALLPIVFTKIKIDPAVASGPFITTIVDIMSVLIYFGLASILLLNNII